MLTTVTQFISNIMNNSNFLKRLYFSQTTQTSNSQKQQFRLNLSYIYLKLKMGASNKTKVAVIDQNKKQQDFSLLDKEGNIKMAFYKSFQQFLENQSLKKLSYIIIRQNESSRNDLDRQENSIIAKKKYNIRQLQGQFHRAEDKRQKYGESSQAGRERQVQAKSSQQSVDRKPTVREKLIAYIQKFSLEQLVVYLLIKDARNYKIPDYEVPYITLITDSLQDIIDHVKTQPKREEPSIFKFKRLVKDLYRRCTVKVLYEEQKSLNQKEKTESEKQYDVWKRLMDKEKIPVDVSFGISAFEQSLISNYSDYIIVNTSKMLTYIIDAKKQFQIDSKIIYFGNQDEIEGKKKSAWMISKGRDEAMKTNVINTIKNCSDIIAEQTSTRPKLTIIFTTNHYSKDQKEFIRSKTIYYLKKKVKQKDWGWIDQMKTVVTSNYDRLKSEVGNFVFAYLITFDCTVPQSEDLKAWLKKNNLGSRIYLYNLQKQSNTISKDSQNRMEKIDKDIQTMINKAGFKIKFQVGPLESIALYQMSQKAEKYFSSRMGLVTTMLNRQIWKQEYCKNNRVKIISNYYIVCQVKKYFQQLRGLIAEEENQSNSYFKDLKIVIYDSKQEIQEKWNQLKNINSIIFVHYSFSKINDFLDIVSVPSLRLSIFVKKALPQYIEALKNVEQSKSRLLSLKGIIVSKNQLLKEVFEEDIQTNSEFQLNFKHFSITNRNSQESIDSLYNFISKFANLWRVGYDIIKAEQDQVQTINTLRQDLKWCLYKCKSYSLLDVSDEEFDYFYIKRLNYCKTFLDLQIATIYMLSLPHGMNKILEQVFSRPRQSSMIPKVFATFIVILLTAFCSIEDEVMTNKSLVVYIDNTDIVSKINSLNIGDVLFNTSFIPSGKNESDVSNDANHCIFIEFETIPMLSDSFVRNYLYIQRFSFYKESAEYLIAPYTHFVVKSKTLTPKGKYHILLHAINDELKGFARNVLKVNSIDEKQLFNTIKEEIYTIDQDESFFEMSQDVKSLYKKAEIISLYEEKKQMVKSMSDSLEYKNFMNAMSEKRHLSALNHINLKFKQEKLTTQVQANYYKVMLGVQRSLIYFKVNEFDQSIKELQKVEKFLDNEENSWVKKNIQSFKQSMSDLSTKRHKLFNRAPKVKKWKIQAVRNQSKIQLVMEQQQFTWSINYLPKREDFYLVNTKDKKNALMPYQIKQNYGQHVPSFTNDMVYQTSDLQTIILQDNKLGSYFKFIIDSTSIKKTSLNPKQLKVKHSSSSSPHKNSNKNKEKIKTVGSLTLNPQKSSEKQEKVGKVNSQQISNKVNDPLEPIIPAPTIKVKPQIKPSLNIFEQFEEEQIEEGQSWINQPKKTSPIKNISNLQKLLGVTETIGWQSFYIGDKFVLTKKGKHIKGKMANKIH